MGELKRRKYLGILGILLLVVGIIFLFSYGKIDKYKGLVKVKNVEVNKKILSSVANTEAMTSNGTDEIDYEIKYTLDRIDGIETRNAVIEASLNSEYAEFKEINGNNIESTVSNEGKKIEVRINNVRLGEEQTLNLIIIVRNAPNNEEISPVIRIKEATGEYTEVIGEKVTVHTGSILGVVYDENRLPVGNIELSINRNGREIRRTYTREDGVFNFSDLDDGEYLIKVEEDNYEIESGSNKRISDNLQEIKVKTVDKFDIETHKYVERLKLVIDGQEKTYTYKDKEKVVEALKNAKEVSGEIEYKIVVKNRGEKDTAIERVIDERGEGLKFNQEKNAGWEEDDEKIYYRPLEGVSLSSGETREVRLILDIEKTKEIKTYINKLTTKGEIKEKVIYILDGRKIKEESVIEGDKVSRPSIEVEGWYTDKNFTNKYNFNREVNKDLILYAKTEELKHIVTFVDKDPDTEAENIIEQVEVRDKEKVSEKPGPSKIGYNFVCWRNEYGICYNFNDKVERDITLTSSYEPIVYTIEYEGITSEERTSLNNPTSYTVRSNIVLNNPNNRKDEHGFDREIFVGWKEREADTPSTDIRLPDRNSLGNKKYTAIFERIEDDEYPITYILNGGTVSGNPNVYKKTDTFTLNNPTKEGYTFTGWTGSNGDTPKLTVTVPIGTTGPLSFEAHYSPVIYNITYNLDGGSLEQGVTNPDTYTIETPTFTINNPSKTGYDFIGWSGTEIEGKSSEVIISQGSKGDRTYTANYKKKKYTVTYMDGENLQGTEEVEYNEKALGNVERPSKPHNIFIGWTLNNELYNFDTPVTEDITLYSSYELVEPPVITHRPTEWTRENVIVNITSNHNDYSYKYRVLDGENINYAGEFVIEENTDIYGYSEKNGVVSEEVKHEIRNIDRINPRINSITNTVSATSATLTIKGQDLESGIGYIKIYKENELVFSTEEYPGNNNEEQTETVTIGNLTELSSYTFKVEVIDKVGNSTTQDITIETIDKHYVARTYEDDGTEIKKYETLREAIESPECVNRCNIQMLDNVTEVNTILDGQEIKLDLNGLTITGLQDKAFENNGMLQIVDYNENEIGKIYSEGTGIINNGTLTVGENEVELNVSKVEPIIEGSVNGVYTPGEFRFFDGKIIGGSTAGALRGTSPITPYSYNASIESSGGKEIATLEIIADAEARINSVYYTKVQEAVDDSKNGSYSETEYTRIYKQQVLSNSDYRFIYDTSTGYLVNNNTGISSTTANSYLEIDLTNAEYDQTLTVQASISSQSGYDYGYATIKDTTDIPDYSDTEGRFMFISGTVNDGLYKYRLEKGNKYYLHLGYRKNENTNTGNDRLLIKDIYLDSIKEANIQSENITNEFEDDIFYVDDEGNIVTNNYNKTPMFAHGYIEYDLTDKTSDLLLTFHIDATQNSAYRRTAIDVTDSPTNYVHPSNESGHDLYFRYNTEGDYSIRIHAGQKSYVHFTTNNIPVSYGITYTKPVIISNIDYYWEAKETNTSTIAINQPIVNQDVDNVQIIRNITMTNPMDIVDTRDVVLDLNGYTLTSSKEDYIIKNNGSLKIIDSNFDDQIEEANQRYAREVAMYQEEYENEQEEYNNFISSYTDYYNEHGLKKTFDYKGSEDTFVIPVTGNYKLKVWGAQGGNYQYSSDEDMIEGGFGGYSEGVVHLNKGDILYINIGGQAQPVIATQNGSNGGYNGGGNGSPAGTYSAVRYNAGAPGGGGATHIATSSGLLSSLSDDRNSILIVAGGGGGANNYSTAGSGGGQTGASSIAGPATGGYATGGTQESGYAFGQGGSGRNGNNGCSVYGCEGNSGGGGGFFGGYATTRTGSYTNDAGAGGSGYIGNTLLSDKKMVMYSENSDYESTDIDKKTNITTNVSLEAKDSYAKKGNGYATIELIDNVEFTDEDTKSILSGYNSIYNYTGSYQEFTAPITGKYKVEAWGGSGSVTAYGAYTKGNIELQQGEKLYIYVGNKYTTGNNKTTFNGGTGNQGGYNGGSSTDIRLVPGDWNNSESLASRIMVAAGGGSGDGSSGKPGAAGGLIGYSGGGTTGGTQTSVGNPESSSYTSSSFGIANGGCTGGNGYYPGSGSSCSNGSGGGSSYISGHTGTVAIKAADDITPKQRCLTGNNNIDCSYHYSGKVFTNTKMVDGQGYLWSNVKAKDPSGMTLLDGTVSNGNPDSGAVRISIAEPELKEAVLDTHQVQSGNITSTTSSVILNNYSAYLNIDEAIINLNKAGSLDVITNRGSLTIGDNGFVNGTQANNRGINNTTSGDILDGSGTITMSSTNNIGILNDSVNDEEIKGYKLLNTSTNSYNIYNNSINDLILDGINSSGNGIDIYQNTDNNLTVKNSTLKSSGNESFYSNQSSVESNILFINDNIGNRIYNRNGSSRIVTVKDSNMSGTRQNIYNESGTIIVDNSKLENSSYNIDNFATAEIKNNTKLTSTYRNILARSGSLDINKATFDANEYNIFNQSSITNISNSTLNTKGLSVQNGYTGDWSRLYSGTISINNTNITKSSTSDSTLLYNHAGSMSVSGGTFTNDYELDENNPVYNSTFINNTNNGTLVVKDNVETNDKFNRGIYNNGIFTLGNNEDSSVSKTYPLIKAKTMAIYNENPATFNYYDGKLIGQIDNTIDGHITDVPLLHDLDVTKDDHKEIIVLKTDAEKEEDQSYVAKIGSTKYVSLQKAFDAVESNNTQTTIELIKDIVGYQKQTLNQNKNVILDYKGKTIKAYNVDTYIENNGTLEFNDSNQDVIVNNTYYSKPFILNNGTINYKRIKSNSLRIGYCINNTGTLNINSGDILSYENKLIENTGTLNITNGKLYATRTDRGFSGKDNMIENKDLGEAYITGGEFTFIGHGAFIYNENKVDISNAKFNAYGNQEWNPQITYSWRYNPIVNNATSNSEAKIKGGTYGDTAKFGKMIINNGTAWIEDLTSNFNGSFDNTGTLHVKNVIMPEIYGRNVTGNVGGYPYLLSETGGINNTGILDITGGSYTGTGNNALFNNQSSGQVTVTNTDFTKTNEGYLLYANGTSTNTMTGVTLTSTATGNSPATVYLESSATLAMTDSSVENKSTYYSPYSNAMGNAITQTNTSVVTLTNTDVKSERWQAIRRTGSGNLTITGGDIVSNTPDEGITNSATGTIVLNPDKITAKNATSAVYNSAVSTITIGELGGVPSKTKPDIEGKTYGVNNTNPDATINFYDGVIKGQTSIQGKVEEIEPNYEIILETYTVHDDSTDTDVTYEKKYLDRVPICINRTKVDALVNPTDEQIEQYKYYTIQEGIDAASSGDTIEILRELTSLPDYPTMVIPSGMDITIDLNGYKLIQSNQLFFRNNGTLTMKSTIDGGRIEATDGQIFENNGTLNITSGKYNSDIDILVIDNKENCDLNITGGEIFSVQGKLINNEGNLVITNGKLYATRTDNGFSGKNNMIENTSTGIVEITGGEFTFIGHGAFIYNENKVDISNAKFNAYGNHEWNPQITYSWRYNPIVNNATSNSEAKIKGGTYGDTAKFGKMIINNGTAWIEDLTSNFNGSFDNAGTLHVKNVIMPEIYGRNVNGNVGSYPYLLSETGGINNTGILDITGGSYTGSGANALFYNQSSGQVTVTNTDFTKKNEDCLLIIEGASTTTMTGATLTSTSTGYSPATVKASGSATLAMTDSSVENKSPTYSTNSNAIANAILQESTSVVTLTNTDVKSERMQAIRRTGSGNLTITGGDIVSNTLNEGINNLGTGTIVLNPNKITAKNASSAVYNSGESTITIGELGGVPSKTKPDIEGKTYGINNTNPDATINFYDGVIKGQTSIQGKVEEIEPDYEIILETYTVHDDSTDTDVTYEKKYLDKVPVCINRTKVDALVNPTDEQIEQYKYDTIQEGIDAASSGDTLELIRELTTMPSSTIISVPNSKEITLDLNGYKIIQNNSVFIENNGTLNMKTSKDNGRIESNIGIIMVNNNTLNINSGKYFTNNTDYVLKNNANATMNITGGEINADNSHLITNRGILNISGGTIHTTRTDRGFAGSDNMIDNLSSGEVYISGGEFTFVGKGAFIYNEYKTEITNGKFNAYGCQEWNSQITYAWYYNSVINNATSTSEATISGGTYGDVAKFGKMIINNGTARIENITSSFNGSIENSGTLEVENLTMEETHARRNTGNTGFPPYLITEPGGVVNTGDLTMTNVTFKGHVNDCIVRSSSGNMIINGTTNSFDTIAAEDYGSYVFILTGDSITSIDNSSITLNMEGHANAVISVESNAKLNLTSSTLTNNNRTTSNNYRSCGLKVTTSDEVNITNSNINAITYESIYKSGTGTLNIDGGNYNSSESTRSLLNEGTGVTNIISGTIESDIGNGVYINSVGTVNVGSRGGIPSITDPIIIGKTYGLYNSIGKTSNFYFYDGIIKGETGSIYGTITDTEPGYKEKRDNVTDPDTEVETIDSTLTVVGETERVAVVNNVNFMSLQAAVNYASNNEIENIQMYKSITLEDNIVLPTGGSNVKIYLNGNTITKGDYTLGDGITEEQGQAPSGVGGKIYRFLADITGTEINPKNIVIFEMSDGSRLESTVTYKLYKLTDNGYKIVKVNENLIGNYDLGSEKEEMNVTRGKLYIYGIGEGTYKLVGTDTKEITFEINADDVSNNIRINNAVKANRTVSVIATVILQLQTGVARSPYILVIMVLIIVILGFIAYKKHKESYEE